ncbi:MAG: hypothetical protein LBI18_04380 [Planctomycetaceae bacterium]|jgi:hypothetical protein|nr:hypothetical protein [Planctomycetaceae bacterium]
MNENHFIVEIGNEKLLIKPGLPEFFGFTGGIGCLGALSSLGGVVEQLEYFWVFCALFAFISVAFFKKSSINLRMPERLIMLGFLGFLGYLGYIPGMEFLKGLHCLYFFFGFSGFLGFPKKHFY